MCEKSLEKTSPGRMVINKFYSKKFKKKKDSESTRKRIKSSEDVNLKLKRQSARPKKNNPLPKKVPNSSRLDYYSREMKRRDYKAKRNLDLSRKKDLQD